MPDTDHQNHSELSFTVFVADLWEHVCPIIRITGPASMAGVKVIKGNEWLDGKLEIYPERVSEGDLVIIQRNFPENEEAYKEIILRARAQNKPVVYELDDLLPELPDQHPDFYHYLTTRSAIVRAIFEADAVIGSTPTIRDTLLPFNQNTWTIPNFLNDSLWRLPSSLIQQEATVTIGYLGSHSHSYDLEVIEPVLLDILEKYGEKISFKFWGIAPPTPMRELPNVEWLDVGLVSYAAFADYFVEQTCDIFIAPLTDNPFNRAKSQLKYLEYGALGIPGVFSRVTPYESIVKHAETGFLASTNDEWKEYLEQLINDPELRNKLGRQAQQHVRNEWMLSDNLDKWTSTYQEILANPRRSENSTIGDLGIKKMLSWQSDLERQAFILHQQIGDVTVQLDQVTQSLNHKIESTKQELDTTQKRLEENIRQLDATKQQLYESERQLDEMEQQLHESEQQLLLYRQKDKTNKIQLKNLEDQLSTKSNELTEMHNTSVHFHNMYQEIYNSRSWRLMRKFQTIRLRLIPQNSRLEYLFRMGTRAARYLITEGPVAFIKAINQKLSDISKRNQIQTHHKQSDLFPPAIIVSEGQLCNLPAISIILCSEQFKGTDIISVQSWLRNQTLPSAATLVVWDTQGNQAWFVEKPDHRWDISDFNSLLENLETKYISIASVDLLLQLPTYLEYNLIALETENLAFTVNFRGSPKWLIERVHNGFLPGNRDFPLLRQIVQKEYIQSDLTLNLASWGERQNGQTKIVGKIIFHTTNDIDTEDSLPAETPIHGIETRLSGNKILGRVSRQSNWDALSQELRTTNSVIPAVFTPNDLPTVVIVMPFIAVGGAEQIVLKNIQHSQEKIRFLILSLETPNHELGTLDDAYRNVTPYIYSLPNFLAYELYWSQLTYLMERFDPVSIYIANGTPWIYDAINSIKIQYPNLRIANQVYDAEVGWINRYDDVLATCIDAHLAPNSKITDAYIAKGVNPANTFVIENGIEPDELNPGNYTLERIAEIKNRLQLPLNKKIVTFASRIHFQKRPIDYVELARRFSSDQSTIFIMIGDGPMAVTVDEQVAKIGLKNFYRFPFYRPISDILAITDVLVLPSEFEGMPMIITESLTMGKPVVCTDVGNNREILNRVNGGIIIRNIGDIQALLNGVRKMLSAPPNPEALRQAALSNWDIASISEQFRDVLLG